MNSIEMPHNAFPISLYVLIPKGGCDWVLRVVMSCLHRPDQFFDWVSRDLKVSERFKYFLFVYPVMASSG